MRSAETARAIVVIDDAQETIWNLHHKVKEYDVELGMKIWEQTLQIEHAVKVLREEFEKDGSELLL